MVVKEVLKQLAGQGRTILFCSHILDVVERMCTRIVIINNRQQIADGTADATHPRLHDSTDDGGGVGAGAAYERAAWRSAWRCS
jgi:ABC-type multidrug transport system ATPase subunit